MSTTPPITVLVVDDHAAFRDAVAALLGRAAGFALVGQAADGADAVRQVEVLEPDLVLMDVRMPGLDGIAATTLITRRRPGTRVVLLSTDDLPGIADATGTTDRASACGAIGFLRKEDLGLDALRALWDRATPPAAGPPD